jgi:hypothetical protein
MREVSNNNFGLLIAYVIPGYVALWGAASFSATVQSWLGVLPASGPTVSGFLHVTVASVGAGVFASTVRWLLIDTIHFRTGVPRRDWDYSALQENMAAFEFMVANQYRYYQFFSNTLVSLTFAYGAHALSTGWPSFSTTLAVVSAGTVLWLGSRDTLRNYHTRVGAFLRAKPAGQGTPQSSKIPDDSSEVLLKINF